VGPDPTQGGGLLNDTGTVTVFATILAHNEAGNGGNDCSGTVVSQGSILLLDAAGCTLAGILSGNQVGIDPQLGPLQDNGGLTLSRAPSATSPLLDAVLDGTCPATDQHGVTRPLDANHDGVARCDIGAVERAP
jgi:hypothetical protein